MNANRWLRTFPALFPTLLAATLLLSSIAGCASDGSAHRVDATMTAQTQRAMSPDQALARLVEGNRRFVAGTSLHRDLGAQRDATASGQYPFAVVLSCIDSRSAPEYVFDQGIGDVFVPRIAGNYSNADILGSMEFATKVAGARLIVVMGHTECGAVKGACDNVELGNLTTVIRAIRPAVDATPSVGPDRSSANHDFVVAATESNVRRTVDRIRTDSEILRGLEQSGQIKIVGAMHDLKTGRVTFLD
jgi:carbonic anhydrase